MTPTALCILVVDDEAPIRDELAYLLGEDVRVGTVLVADDGGSALRLLGERDVDAVFLDIRMPGLDGLDIARILRKYENAPPFVFVSAYDSHAVEAFDLRAVDYLLKPIRPDRVREAVTRISGLLPPEDQADDVAAAEAADQSALPPAVEAVNEKIAVDVGGSTRFVQRSDVRYVEAHGDYARLVTPTGRFLVRVALSALEAQWTSAGFARIHRRWLVNLSHVDEVVHENGRMTLVVAGDRLEVSRRHTRAVRDMLVRSARLGRS
jgi:DNA-binding LytR/AlgR family response regulator